jgi:hypothetical protein
MNSWSKVLCPVLLLALGVSAGYGWGNATHVYFAKQLGSKVGIYNLNEMYGALLPDMYNLVFTEEGQVAAYKFHFEQQVWQVMYDNAPSAYARAAAFGFFTHNNLWGADFTAHGSYESNNGWIVRQGIKLSMDPEFVNYIAYLLGAPSPELGAAMGHDLVETAVDILVKRNEDPLVGARMYMAAKSRSADIGSMLALVETGADQVEPLYRESMMQYGQLFLLPESQLIPMLAQVSAGVAADFIAANGGTLLHPIDPQMVEKFIQKGIQQVAGIYRPELARTLQFVEKNLKSNNITPVGPAFAFFKNENAVDNDPEIADMTNRLPSSYSLDQNYPNPFNPSTRISYALPNDVPVTLKIYNSIGQEVATLVEGLQSAGVHRTVWEAGGLPSGVYIYRLTAGTFVETKKMTLMK